MELTAIADYQCVTGEGPLWHPDEQRLYWVDIPQGRLFRYDPQTGQHEQLYEGDPIGGFTIQADGALLLFMAQGAIRIWRAGHLSTLRASTPGEEDSRFNDVIADPAGRVFCGTMPTATRLGNLYRLETDGTLHHLLSGIGTSNGLGFTPDRQQLYYTITREKKVYVFDYAVTTGAITNQRVFVDSANAPGSPDGLTVDAEGDVWSARWDGACLIRYAPDGTEERRISFPTKKISCLTFGGPDYTDMYVTTAGGNDRAANGATAGALYHLNLGIQGVPEFRSRIGL
ncbi:MAG: SMP-30/gluconolactonase/LRE family protein [Caldilineaceae bacterium]|nr:SMP-30/gluconolactonase/LRE family protein [Caldilineaceae bacterium]